MIETDSKTQRDAKWFREYELDNDQLERLIEEKFIRAREYFEALNKREVLCGDR